MKKFNWFFKNKLLSIILITYSLLMLSVINWGLPNLAHPFTYHMDEWHQLQAIRTTFKNLSANVPGSAHGTMFHFILSGFYLVPFFLLKIINPFILKSSVDQLLMQQKLFEILRINTLIFGLLSIFFIAKIAKKYLKVSSPIAAILFTISPLWVALSNYFKYDIALTFWIIFSIFCLLKFKEKPTLKNYIVAGIACALALATKVSALPLLILYIFSYFWFMDKAKRKLRELFLGILTFIVVFIPLGIPDLVLGRGDYKEFLFSNLVVAPGSYNNLLTGFASWWQYLIIRIFPMDFGYVFFVVYVCAILYWLITLIRAYLTKDIKLLKVEAFLVFAFGLFLLSLFPLGIGANGNRLSVLLPFCALLTAAFLQRIKKYIFNFKLVLFIFALGVFIQLFQSGIMIYLKIIPDVRQVSSQWIQNNIKKDTLIGIENIPIYQMLPDILLKEYSLKERMQNYPASFNYQIVDVSSKTLPPVVVITNRELELNFFRKSQKKLLVERLNSENYKEIIEFKPPAITYLFTGNYLDFYISGLVPIPTISIFRLENSHKK